MEGPSIIILKEAVQDFKGKEIKEASGNAGIDFDRVTGQRVIDFKSWGKHFIIGFKSFSIRIHFLMFGSYRINERNKKSKPRLYLRFENGELNCYACSVKLIEDDLNEVYEWDLDIMSPNFKPSKIRKRLQERQEEFIGDVLLNPEIFSGVGNIIRNEVLYRVKVHPDSKVGNIPPRKLTTLILEARNYSFDFLKWKKKYELKKHWEIYTKKKCPMGHTIIKVYPGKTRRRSFICDCMVKF